MPTEVQIIATLYNKLSVAQHGTNIDILKYAGTSSNMYGQGDATYDPAVTIPGRGILDPAGDMISDIGGIKDDIEIAFLFDRQHLNEAFPGATPPDWIDVKDRVGFEGQVYDIVQIHPTGKAFQNYLLLLVLGASLVDEADRPYP